MSESLILGTFALIRRVRIFFVSGTIYYARLAEDEQKLASLGLTRGDLNDRIVAFNEAAEVTKDTMNVMTSRVKVT